MKAAHRFEGFRGAQLADVQAWFRIRSEMVEGAICPCCDRFGKVYRRKLNAGMAVALLALYRLDRANPERVWFSKDEFVRRRAHLADYGKLRYWGFVVQKETEEDDDQRDSGLWRITKGGRAFANMELLAPRYAIVYNDVRLRFDDNSPRISVVEALGKKFSYSELMNSKP